MGELRNGEDAEWENGAMEMISGWRMKQWRGCQVGGMERMWGGRMEEQNSGRCCTGAEPVKGIL